ncbi:EutN/CcmL family microcompartment protein [Christensenella timonensis]|uniref:EutN/CcmL family microcompartment protein n=1 Tax=Christensenella timonensis TaxID=1816678 RepID=UPI000831BF41|nr:EutN/CcmL family microcompartment protein [Christensenella timonensis]
MYTGRVEGTVVSTVKNERLTGIKLLVVRLIENGEDKNLIVAGDATRQAGIGDLVYMIGRKEAALMFGIKPEPPVDVAIVGFIDDYNEVM